MHEKVAWGSAIPGQYIDAGLPNIEGRIKNIMAVANATGGEGAFSRKNASLAAADGKQVNISQQHFIFDASQSNAIYGKSTTVQPASYTVRYIIRALP